MSQQRIAEVSFEGFEQLREVVPGTRRDIVQLEGGVLSGTLLHTNIGDLPVDAVTFSLGVRSRGEYPKDRVTMGMLLSATADTGQSALRTVPGDVMLTPPGLEQENTYRGATSIFVTSLPQEEIERTYDVEAGIRDLKLTDRTIYKGERGSRNLAISNLTLLLERLRQEDTQLTAEGAAYWKRAVVEAMLANAIGSSALNAGRSMPSAKVVRAAEEFVESKRERAVHISEICLALRISRRTLHRAFEDIVGVGPIAYLRYRRLCAIHSILRSGARPEQTIQNLALEFGFLNAGRLAQYFRAHFGKLPAEIRMRSLCPGRIKECG